MSNELQIIGANENNLKNLNVSIPHHKITVITGVSGSGKSTLAFDIIFGEGQRRFMESMSAWSRQFIEQMPRPDVDRITGIPPTVAIEQRITRGSSKSTVATITEVAQFLRLLYARCGIQYSPKTNKPVSGMTHFEIDNLFSNSIAEFAAKNYTCGYLCAPIVRGRKGHYQPLINWAIEHGFKTMRIDGSYVELSNFIKLDRFREHDLEIVVATFIFSKKKNKLGSLFELLLNALTLGKGSCFLSDVNGKIIKWFSTKRVDSETGEAFPELDPKHFSWNSAKGWCPTCRGYGQLFTWMKQKEDFEHLDLNFEDGIICPNCHGDKLNILSRNVHLQLKNKSTITLPQLLRSTPNKLINILNSLNLGNRDQAILNEIKPEITERLKFLDSVGLNYLTLNRATATLSGGEAQRIRLASQLGSNLSGVLYVLDEPSIGLHASDNARLLESLIKLRNKGNTLIIVEHDEGTMQIADRVIDLGPGAGIHGGELIANTGLKSILKNKLSLTGRYLKTPIKHPLKGKYRALPKSISSKNKRISVNNNAWLVATKVSLRNLKGDDLFIPIGRLTMICGVSGAGKSTLIRNLLKPVVSYTSKNKLNKFLGKGYTKAGISKTVTNNNNENKYPFKELLNGDIFRNVIEVDQSPIGKTSRSTPSTYVGAFDIVRMFFGQLPEAKMRGMNAGTFSFNTTGGRCEYCKGAGRIKLEMNFMPDAFVNCDGCNGNRYGSELDDIRWKDKNISDVLNLTFEEALEFFSFHSRLKDILSLIVETGLGYLKLGQNSATLSGGEAQRLKLATELAKGLQTFREKSYNIKFRNLYILEEPTIGLHLYDCEKLILLLHRLVDQGHTVIVIEHHLDLIAEADYVVELGPEGGDGGGEILYQGDIRGLIICKKSKTAKYLNNLLNKIF